jgi:hypothetical protein
VKYQNCDTCCSDIWREISEKLHFFSCNITLLQPSFGYRLVESANFQLLFLPVPEPDLGIILWSCASEKCLVWDTSWESLSYLVCAMHSYCYRIWGFHQWLWRVSSSGIWRHVVRWVAPACSLVCWTNSSTLKMEAIRSSETSGATQQITWRHIPDVDTLQLLLLFTPQHLNWGDWCKHP